MLYTHSKSKIGLHYDLILSALSKFCQLIMINQTDKQMNKFLERPLLQNLLKKMEKKMKKMKN